MDQAQKPNAPQEMQKKKKKEIQKLLGREFWLFQS